MFHAGGPEGAAPFGARVASSTMMSTAGRDAGKTQLKRQARPAADHLHFGKTPEWGDHLQSRPEAFSQRSPPRLEKKGRRIRKRIMVQRPKRQGRNFLHGGEDGSLDREHQVAPGKINGLIALP